MNMFTAWESIAAKAAELQANPTPICELRPGVVRAVCGVVGGMVASTAGHDVLVKLHDHSGSVQCCLHGDVVEDHPFAITIGAAMLLRNVNVMSSINGLTILVCRHHIVSLVDVSAMPIEQPTLDFSRPAEATTGVAPFEPEYNQTDEEL